MAETDSREAAAMAESLSLMMKARDLLATPSHEGLATIVNHLFMSKETSEHGSARALYDFCVANFSNCLTLMHLNVYRHSSDGVVRFRSIFLLSETLTKLRRDRGGRFDLSPFALNDIKPLLISCLTMPNAAKFDTKILRIVVSSVASSVDNGGWNWDDLGDCILSLANTDPLRAFSVFLELPPVNAGFINRFLGKLREEVEKFLFHPVEDRDEDWTLALETAVKLGIQRSDSAGEILETLLRSSDELVSMGMEEFLQAPLRRLAKFLEKDKSLRKWSSDQCGFVAEFAFRIAGIGSQTRETARKIHQTVRNHNPAFKLSPSRDVENQDRGLLGGDSDFYKSLTHLSAFEILSNFAETNVEDRNREIAMRRLHHLLCNSELDVSEIINLQPLLISCLKEEGMSENTFRILGQVIFHVAQETFVNGKDPWFDLWDYIASETKAEFDKAVYIFQCLTMRFEDVIGDFVVPALNNLLPEMCKRINPPREVLVDNSSWVLAFTGAFCAAVRLLKVVSHAGFVKEIEEKMVGSVRELVERGMEVGLVRRAFRDFESIVEKQCDWYETCEFGFVKGFVGKLYAIQGMKMESKMVLWRINGILERSVNQKFKALPHTD